MNLNQASNKIEELTILIHAEEKRRVRLGIIKHELDILRQEHQQSHLRLHKEKREMESLEGKNIKTIFTEILGNKKEQLENERQEYLQEVLHHNGLVDEIEILEYEEKVLKEKCIDNLPQLKKDIRHLLDYKERLLREDQKYKPELRAFDNKLIRSSGEIRDIVEAINEAKNLEQKFHSIIRNLKQVKKWGPYRMHGKGRYSSYNKKTYIDKANREAIVINVQIKKFNKELKDVYPDMDITMSMEFYKNFIDHFYNNLITDWMIQKKLTSAINSISNMLNQLTRILLMLSNYREQSQVNKKNILEEKENFIKSII